MTENLSSNNVSNEKLSLLGSFSLKMLEQYNEPQRKGISRGEPIGFSKQKYCASLVMLKKIPLKNVAETSNVSYGLVRKWRTEDRFIEQIEENESAFTLELFNHLIRRGKKQKELANDYFNNPVGYITQNYPPALTWNEFLDLKFYTQSLVITIISRLAKHYERKYKKAIDRINEISLCKLDDELSNDDILTMAVSHQILSFYKILQGYNVETKREISELTKKMDASADKSRKEDAELTQLIIAIEWKKTGTLSERAIKKSIHTIHNLSGNFTLVDMNY